MIEEINWAIYVFFFRLIDSIYLKIILFVNLVHFESEIDLEICLDLLLGIEISFDEANCEHAIFQAVYQMHLIVNEECVVFSMNFLSLLSSMFQFHHAPP